MPSRRFHHKRRHGCTNCKQRKARCGGERPSCQHCLRLGTRCSYLDADHSEHRTARHKSSWSQESIGTYDLPIPADDHHRDAALITHYSTALFSTTTDDTRLFETWQVTISDLARSCPYPRHGLLAFSAMDIAFPSSPERQALYVDVARQHLGKALETYISWLLVNREESCPALFNFSSILPALSLSLSQSTKSDIQGEDYVRQFIDIWDFLLGATVVAIVAREWINDSILSSLVTLKTLENVLPHVDHDPRAALQILLDQVKLRSQSSTCNNQEQQSLETPTELRFCTSKQVNVYENSIELFSNALAREDGEAPQLAAVIGWPVFIDGEFPRLLTRNDPMALVILGYYGGALHRFCGFWWLQGLGARLIKAVIQMLAAEFSPLLQWPLTVASILV